MQNYTYIYIYILDFYINCFYKKYTNRIAVIKLLNGINI